MAKKKAVKKTAKKVKRVRYYGMVSIRKGAKIVWLSHENKNGWSLGLSVKGRPAIWLRNVRFSSPEEVSRAVGDTTVVFTHKVEA